VGPSPRRAGPARHLGTLCFPGRPAPLTTWGEHQTLSRMTQPTSLVIVSRWLDAVNAGDAARVMELSAPGIEIVGPRGVARGREVLGGWLERANVRLETRRVFAHGERVVVEQHASWRSEGGAVQGEAAVATRFDVQRGLVAQLERYDDLSKALAAAGLTEGDVVSDPTPQ
jgi:hypothetical protein